MRSLLLLALLAGRGFTAAASAVETPAMDALLRLSRSEAATADPLERAGGDAAADFDGARLRPGKKFATRFTDPFVWTAYKVDRALSPHRPFSRGPVITDVSSLRDQAARMTREIRSDFLVEDGKLFLYMKPMSLGDMDIWQGVYTALAVLQYTSDPSPENEAYAENAFDGLRMMYAPGLPLLRGVLPDGVRNSDEKDPHYRREGGYQKLEDASIDSAAGWVFGMTFAAQRLPSRRRQAQEMLRRFADDLIANGFSLKSSGGANTSQGDMGKGLVSPPPGVLLTMAALSQAAQSSTDPRYADALDEFSAKRQDVWGAYASMPALWRNSTTNQNIGILALASALLSEQDPERWSIYAHGMVRMLKSIEPTGNSFWLYLSYWVFDRRPEMIAYCVADKDISEWMSRRAGVYALAKKSLLEFSASKCAKRTPRQEAVCRYQDPVHWPLSGVKTNPQPVPMFCRPSDFDWQRNAYDVHDCEGKEFTGLDFLIAYSLALQDGAVTPAE